MSRNKTDFTPRTVPVSEDNPEPASSRHPVQFWIGPYNEGTINCPEGHAKVTGPCGDTMEISLKIQGNKIVESRFQVNGCAVSRACASIAAALAKGKDLEVAWDIDEKEIAKSLPALLLDHQHCAILARDTLRQAIEKYLKAGNRL